MSMFAAVGVADQGSDWLLAGVFLVVSFLVIYPLYIVYVRRRHARRISQQLVTSVYKLPITLAPTELGYIFSTRVTKQQLYATLLDLANRSCIVLTKQHNRVYAAMGPKIDNSLKPFEKLLIGYVHAAEEKIPIEHVIEGNTNYRLSNGNAVRGSRQYVFWWLLREHLRTRGVIEKRMTGRYLRMLFVYAVLVGSVVATVPLVMWRLIAMLQDGEVDLSILSDNFMNGLMFWLLALVPLLIVSFFVLRFKGRMLGRRWLITEKYSRYLGQIDGYREFVRLAHHGKLRFESSELKKEALAVTKPSGIALGYIKES